MDAKQQQLIDSDIASKMSTMPKSLRLSYFLSINHQLSDNLYWLMLASIWMDDPACTPNLEIWIELFSAKRRNRHKLMKKSDRKSFRKLPKQMTAFRAVNNLEEKDTAISWTLDIMVAEKLSRGRQIVSKVVDKESVIAFFDRRKEKEIIVIV